MSKSRELTADEYLSDILKWQDQHSSLPSDQKLSERSSGETVVLERYMKIQMHALICASRP